MSERNSEFSMILTQWTRLVCVIDPEGSGGAGDLVCALVRASPLGARARHMGRLRAFLSLGADEARRMLSATGGPGAVASSTRIVLVIPTEWCGIRPLALSRRMWTSRSGAREEVLRSIESLVPIAADDALAGFIERASPVSSPQNVEGGATGGSETVRSGYLVAASASQLRPWLEALHRVHGRDAEVMAGPMALLGLGLQKAAHVEVIEHFAGGDAVRHTMTYGRFTELGSPVEADGQSGPADAPDVHPQRVHVSWRANERDAQGTEDLAVAAALAPVVAPESYAPLTGTAPSLPRPWLWPAAGALLTLAALWSAGRTTEWRFQSAAAMLERERAAIAEQVAHAERSRAEAQRLARWIEQDVHQRTSSWRSVMPALAAALGALPQDGFLYRIELTSSRVQMEGESRRAAEVLDRIEATSEFARAAPVHPYDVSPERGLETFTIRAERTASTGGEP